MKGNRTRRPEMITEVRDRLGSELERLSRQLTDDLAAELGGATAVCDAPEEWREVQERIRRLGQLVAGLARVEGTLPVDRVGYGSTVVLQDLGSRRRVSYTLVTGDVIDLDEDQVSLASPVGQALLGRKVGDRVAVETPAGKLRYRIVSVTTLPQMLGLMPACA
jgi:transcription elongation factor GreA